MSQFVSGTFTQTDAGINFILPAQSGAQFLKLAASNTPGVGISQTFTTIPGDVYLLTFFYGNVSDPGGIFGTTSTALLQINGRDLALLLNSIGTIVAGSQTMVYLG